MTHFGAAFRLGYKVGQMAALLIGPHHSPASNSPRVSALPREYHLTSFIIHKALKELTLFKSSKHQPLTILPLSCGEAASQAFFLFSKHADLISASGSLHLLFLPGMLSALSSYSWLLLVIQTSSKMCHSKRALRHHLNL